MIVTIIVFVIACMIGCGAGFFIVTQEKKRRRENAMSIIMGHSEKIVQARNPDEAFAPKTTNAAEIKAKLKKAAKQQKTEHDTKSLSSLIMQAGLNINVWQFWLLSFIFGSVVTGLLSLTALSDLILGLLSFSAYLGIPRFFLKFKAARRQKAFLADFADALEAMIRLLKAGMSVTEAIAMVGREFTGPVGDEMSRIYDSQKVGIPLAEAVRKIRPRVPLPEVQMFSTAIAIQVQTGSSLSEVLANLSGVIRARHRLKRKVQALSSEAKVSAMIIGALPVIVALALWGVNPGYIGLLFTHPTGKMLLTGAIVWMSFGVLAMRQMINFRV